MLNFFKKIKKYHWYIFQHEKLFKKQLQLYYQTYSKYDCVLKMFLRKFKFFYFKLIFFVLYCFNILI